MRKKPEKTQQPPETKNRKKKRGSKGKGLYVLLGVSLFLCLIAVGVGYMLNQVDQTLKEVTDDPYKLPDQPQVQQPYEEKKSISFVIVGLDTRKNIGMLNTDVLVVAVANPVTQKLTMVSVPRDTRVEIPGYPGFHKINEVFAIGEGIKKRAESKGQPVTENGMTLLKKTMDSMLGVSVSHYVQLDFEGFSAVIDKLGGVKVDVDRDLVYELPQQGVYRNLKKGTQVLNGEQALGFVRHRMDKRGAAYYSSDYDRNRRQQQVIRAVADKALSMNGVASLTAVLDTVGKHIRTDLSKDQITGLAIDFSRFSSDNIVSLDNGAIWSSPYTLWPKENITAVRTALQTELGTTGDAIQLSDAPIAEFAKAQPASKPQTEKASVKPQQGTSTKGQSGKSTSTQQTPKPTHSGETKPVPDDGQTGQDQETYPSDMPPPDILAPSAPAEGIDTGQSGA